VGIVEAISEGAFVRGVGIVFAVAAVAGLVYGATWIGYRITFDRRERGIDRRSYCGLLVRRIAAEDCAELLAEVTTAFGESQARLVADGRKGCGELLRLSGERSAGPTGVFVVRVAVAAARLLDLPLAVRLDAARPHRAVAELFDLLRKPGEEEEREWYRTWGKKQPDYPIDPRWILAALAYSALFGVIAIFTRSVLDGLSLFVTLSVGWAIMIGMVFAFQAPDRWSGSGVLGSYMVTRRVLGMIGLLVVILGLSYFGVRPR
jgi:hypothetical protein